MDKPTQLREKEFRQAISRAVLRAVEGGAVTTADPYPGSQNLIKHLGATIGIVFRPTGPGPTRIVS
jgi:hypothetical protein